MPSHRAPLVLVAFATLLLMNSHVSAHTRRVSRMDALPRTTLWSWQRREDLRDVDVSHTAIASLSRTLQQDGPALRVQLQRNAALLPADDHLRRIAVVRIETRQPLMNQDTAAAVSRAVLQSIVDTRFDALQIDFDARRSERDWYRAILLDLRAGMPAAMPLSITALASWCSHDRWMQGLPVDEAVPMLFRMEPGERGVHDPEIAIREPLCTGAVGVSTREPWPGDLGGKRVYVFPDGGWQRDGVRQTVRDMQ